MITREIQLTSHVTGVPGLGHFTVAVVEGAITDVPQAFLALLQGAYRGNVSVRLT